MQIKCSYCAMPFALTNEEITKAIETFKQDAHAHYDAHCPKCRRANKVIKKTLELNPITRKMLENSAK